MTCCMQDRGWNLRPSDCQTTALPTELCRPSITQKHGYVRRGRHNHKLGTPSHPTQSLGLGTDNDNDNNDKYDNKNNPNHNVHISDCTINICCTRLSLYVLYPSRRVLNNTGDGITQKRGQSVQLKHKGAPIRMTTKYDRKTHRLRHFQDFKCGNQDTYLTTVPSAPSREGPTR